VEDSADDRGDDDANPKANGGKSEDGGARLEPGARRVQIGGGELGRRVAKL
jgi:hypothetical protein